MVLWCVAGTAVQAELMSAKGAAQDELLQVRACLHCASLVAHFAGHACAAVFLSPAHVSRHVPARGCAQLPTCSRCHLSPPYCLQAVMQRLEDCAEQALDAEGQGHQAQQQAEQRGPQQGQLVQAP